MMTFYASINDALEEMFSEIFAQVSCIRASLFANRLVEFRKENDEAANYCCGIRIFTSKEEARKQYKEWQRKYISAVMKVLVDDVNGLYLVYATDP